jgi:hypothetical protein
MKKSRTSRRIFTGIKVPLAMATLALAGTLYVLAGNAATTVSNIEAESGTCTGNAKQVSDGGASSGQAVNFGGTGTNCGNNQGKMSVRVLGNKLIDSHGNRLVMRGVNRSGTEYACVQKFGPFDGPSDAASVDVMKSWKINVVRVPLNEGCWLGINGAPNATAYNAQGYRQAIKEYVSRLRSKDLYVILENHWSAAGSVLADKQQPMLNRDHSLDFWSSVATTFKDDAAILFDVHNEPFPDNNRDSPAGWTCWRDGGSCPGMSFQAAGMQQLVNVIRGADARNVIMLGGLQYSNALGSWLQYKPNDPLNQLVASWHSYDGNLCNTQTCWESTVAKVNAQVPVITGEIGAFDNSGGYVSRLMPWLDSQGISYLGWTWNNWGCTGGPVLISDYNGTPCPGLGATFKAHLAKQ